MNQSKNLRDCYEPLCEGKMIEKGETGRTAHYSDTNGNTSIVPEKIYQCKLCKEIQILLDQ